MIKIEKILVGANGVLAPSSGGRQNQRNVPSISGNSIFFFFFTKKPKQAGAELCQAQDKLGLAESDFVIEVIFQL
jgi:hypothetical protein